MFFSMEEDIKQCNISAKEVGVKTFLWPQKIKWSQNYFGVKFCVAFNIFGWQK